MHPEITDKVVDQYKRMVDCGKIEIANFVHVMVTANAWEFHDLASLSQEAFEDLAANYPEYARRLEGR